MCINLRALVIGVLEIAYLSLPIAEEQSEMLPVIEFQNAFLAVMFTCFVPPPLFIYLKLKRRT